METLATELIERKALDLILEQRRVRGRSPDWTAGTRPGRDRRGAGRARRDEGPDRPHSPAGDAESPPADQATQSSE